MDVIGCTCSKLPLTLKQFRTLAFVQPTKILRLTFRLYLKTTTWETKRHHQTPKDTIKRQLSSHTSSNSLFGCLGTSVGVAWCLLVSVVVLNCPEITGAGFWEHNMYVCVYIYFYDAWMRLKGVYQCLRLVWRSKCFILEKLQKAKLQTLGTFETSKYQNRPMKAP